MSLTSSLSRTTQRIARWSATHPWRVIAAWFAFVLVAVGLAVVVPTQSTTNADYRVGESGRAAAMVAHAPGLQPRDTESVLVTSRSGPLDTTGARAAAAEVATRLRLVPGVSTVVPPQWNPARTALLVQARLEKGYDDVAPLQAATRRVQEAHPDLRVRETGDVSLGNGIDKRVAEDLSSAEGISLPLTLVLMVLAFGALVAAGIPVLLAVTSVAATIGISAPLSHLVHAESTVSSMIVLIGMAVGVDYSLFYLKRERAERVAGRSTLDAVDLAARTSGHSIVVSGVAVIASLTGLYVAGGATFDSLATGAIVVVAVAVLGSLTVLPALLAKLGGWVDRPRVPLLGRPTRGAGRRRRSRQGGITRRVLGPVVRRPVAALVVSGIAITALALPALGMRLDTASLATLPASIPQVQTMRSLSAHFPGQGASIDVVATGERGPVRTALEDLRARAAAEPAFTGEASAPVQSSRDGHTSVLSLSMPYVDSDPRVAAAIGHLRHDLVPAALSGVAVRSAVGGEAAESMDNTARQRDYLPVVLGFVVLLTLLMMGSAFRSVPVALVSAGLTLASVGVAFGLLTLVFQHGWLQGLLGFTSPGFLVDWIPMFVLVVLVGLSMDYHVFVVSRIREHVARGLPSRLAVERGLEETAGVVTSAAAVMVSVFAIFASLSLIEMKMLGVGLAAAVLVDATVVRLVMLPAVLVLLGERAWWPGRPRRTSEERVEETDPAFLAEPVRVGR